MDQLKQLLARPRILLIGGGILLLVLIPLLLVSLRGTSQRAGSPSSLPQTSQSASSSTIPLSPSDPSVRSIFVSYLLRGTAQEIRTTPQGKFLILTVPGSSVPPLPITASSRVKTRRSENATVLDILPGSQVSVHVIFDMLKRSWSVLLIEITQ